jgi:hypothetical protein
MWHVVDHEREACKGVNVGYRMGYEPDPDPTACAPQAKKR